MRLRNLYPIAGMLLLALMLAGCGNMEGDQDVNIPPSVRFVTVPLDSSEFNYAPTVYWAGSDPDGFVEYYSFADVTDSAAIQNPIAFYDQIPDEAWTDTIATEATIYLLTEEGEQTEHVVYIRCFDNEDAVSDSVVYRTFYRSNQPPNIPQIGLAGASDDAMGQSVIVEDTLFSAEYTSQYWPGHQFQWQSSDPDDRALHKIPLQYKMVIVKGAEDTIGVSDWVDEQSATFADLETGFYTLSVWCRDDAFEPSPAPARIRFNVIRPTFLHDVLFVIEAPNGNVPAAFPKADTLVTYYHDLVEDLRTTAPPQAGMESVLQDLEVHFWVVDELTDWQSMVPPYSLIHQYKMVLIAADQVRSNLLTGMYPIRRNKILVDYLEVGGNIWYQGRCLSYKIPNGADVPGLENLDLILMTDFFGSDGISDTQVRGATLARAEFIGTENALSYFPALSFVDSTKKQNYYGVPSPDDPDSIRYYDNPQNYGETGAGRILRRDEAVATQYFDSFTATYVGEVENEAGEVVRSDNLPFQAPRSVDCFVRVDPDEDDFYDDSIYPDSVSKVENITLSEQGYSNWQGEVVGVVGNYIFITHSEGQEWLPGDSLAVSYKFDPLSEFHLAPCEIRNPRSRSALSTFSYFFMDRESVLDAYAYMITWILTQ